MLYCVLPPSDAASGGTNERAYSTTRSPYRMFMVHTASFRYKDDAYGESCSCPLRVYLVPPVAAPNARTYSTVRAPYRMFMVHTACFRYKDDAYAFLKHRSPMLNVQAVSALLKSSVTMSANMLDYTIKNIWHCKKCNAIN